MLETLLLATCVLLFVLHVYLASCRRHRKYAEIPAVSRRWPIIGNVFDMSRTHLVLTDWYRKYGPVYRMCVWGEEIVVLSDYDSVYEALVTRGSDFAGRPQMSRTDYHNRNRNSVVWQTYTSKLQFLRKQVHSSLRMYGGGLTRLADRCSVETDQLLARIENSPDMTFDPWDVLYDAACNVMVDLTLGKRFSYEGPDMNCLKRINGLFNHTFGPGAGRVLDCLPLLNRFRNEYHTLKTALDMRNKFWDIHGPVYSQQEQEKEECTCVTRDLQKLSEGGRYSHYDLSEQTVKEVFTNLVLAGTDTTTTTITCLLLLLLHKPEIQQKIHREIDDVISTSRKPTLADRASMPFTEACLLETLRYISHVPLAVPHATICDTCVAGKHIPKNTTVYMNLWSVHHDDRYWPEPWTFDPCRFLDASGRLVPPSHDNRRRLLVFGAGRRVCLGETLAKNRLFLFTVSLLQRFNFRSAGTQLPNIDPRSYTLGLVLHPDSFKIKAEKRIVNENLIEKPKCI